MKFDAAWRRQRREETDASLDDLLLFDEPEIPTPPVPARSRPWVARSALIAFCAAAVCYLLFRALGLAPPFSLIFAVCAGVVLVRRAVLVTAEAYPQRTRDLLRPPRPQSRIDPSGWFDDGDGVVTGVRRWDRRLDWGATAPERFAATVITKIGELADERLRQRYGITRASDAQRARRLLGEPLWLMLHEPPHKVPRPGDLALALAALEQL